MQIKREVAITAIGVLLSGTLLLAPAIAIERETSWPKQLPESEYGPLNPYGKGLDADFYRAMYAPGEFPKEDKEYFKKKLPENDYSKWYFKVGIHTSTITIRGIKNKAKLPSYVASREVVDTKTRVSQTRPLLGLGYMSQHWRLDGEYLLTRSVEYNRNPAFRGAGSNLTSKHSTRALLANVYYDFWRPRRVRPFVAGTVGFALNRTVATLVGGVGAAAPANRAADGEEKRKTQVNFAWGMQIGARMRFLDSRLFISGSYQYACLGQAKWRDHPGTNVLVMNGNLIFSGYRLDFLYLI